MLGFIFILFLILWALGLVGILPLGGLAHIFLLGALMTVVIGVIQRHRGRSA